MQARSVVAAFIGAIWWAVPAPATGFLCAGSHSSATVSLPEGAAAKPARIAASTTGTRRALVLFARFKGENTTLPSWAGDLFDPALPGSVAHFYDTMSFGKLQLRGEVASRVYESSQPASAYLADDQTPEEDFGRFSQEILRQADRDIDFAQYDNDGPDGIPDSGDDDGVVDAVFLVLDRIPSRFLQGEATGIMGLGFTEVFLSSDTGAKGKAIQIFPGQGTLQQGRSFAEAVGSMCHEYGHVLGLPDLYNTDFINAQGAGPEEDGAGVGAWCLMGWGASGWNGDDGPNSFCAWSRMKLGWAGVVAVAEEHQDIRLEEVGKQGQVVRVPLTGQEYFLVEYRRRTSTYYDRNIPGEGLLIWHIGTRRLENALASQVVVDLECADGRWQDAGYPLGKIPAPLTGEDDLDFWAHDDSYAHAHAGNLGDATDPFDGVRFADFTPQTNPAAQSGDLRREVRIEDIRLVEGTAFAQVHTAPLLVEVDRLNTHPLVAGEEYQIEFRLNNRGGVSATNLRAMLSTRDSLVEILQAESLFRDLDVERSSTAGPLGGVYPKLRFKDTFAGTHRAELALEIYAGDELVNMVPLTLSAISLRQSISQGAVIDTAGNGDGKAQRGEFIRLGLQVEVEDSKLLSLFEFSLRPLDERVRMVNGPEVIFSAALGRQVRSPEFLLPSDLEPGVLLPFAFESRSDSRVWKDTLWVRVESGDDQTPPRVLQPLVTVREGTMEISVLANLVLEGGSLRSVSAQIFWSEDTTLVAVVPMEAKGGRYTGTWSEVGAGYYMVQVVAVDQAGNLGRSAFRWNLLTNNGQSVPERAATFLGKGSAYEAIYAPDGQLLAVSSSGGIWLYETSSFQEVGLLEVDFLDQFSSPAMAISPDSQVLASGSSDGVVQLWDLRTQQEISRLDGHPGGVTGLRFSPDGRLLYSAGADNRVRIWDLGERAEVAALEDGRIGIDVIELSPDGTLLATGTASAVRVWDLNQRQVTSRLEGQGLVGDLTFSPDGKVLAAAEGFNVRLWDVQQGLELGVLKNRYSVNRMAFSPDGQTLALAGSAGVQLWEVKGQRPLGTIGGSKWASTVFYSPDGQTLAFPQEEGVQIWDLKGQQARTLLTGFGRRLVGDLAFSADGRTLAVGEWGGIVRLWDMVSQSEVRVLQRGGPVLAFSPDERVLASGGNDNKVWLLDLQGQEQPELIETGEGRVQDLAFSPDGNLLAVAGFPNFLRLWDMGRQQYHWYFSHQAVGTGLAFSPDGRFLATNGPAGSTVWEVATQQEVGTELQVLKDISAVCFSPDSRWLALGDRKGLVHLVEVAQMQEVEGLEGQGQAILKLAFSPDSRFLAGGTADGRIALWEVGSRQLAKVLKGHSFGVGALAFSPDGQVLASGGLDGMVRLWRSVVPTAVEEQATNPRRFALEPNYPNPFNPTTTLRFSLPQAGEAELSIYNLLGQRVATLVHGVQEAGPQVLQWNGRDEQGRELASGVYFYRLQAGAQVETRKLLLLR